MARLEVNLAYGNFIKWIINKFGKFALGVFVLEVKVTLQSARLYWWNFAATRRSSCEKNSSTVLSNAFGVIASSFHKYVLVLSGIAKIYDRKVYTSVYLQTRCIYLFVLWTLYFIFAALFKLHENWFFILLKLLNADSWDGEIVDLTFKRSEYEIFHQQECSRFFKRQMSAALHSSCRKDRKRSRWFK